MHITSDFEPYRVVSSRIGSHQYLPKNYQSQESSPKYQSADLRALQSVSGPPKNTTEAQ
jgi:hypothetical protein